MAVYSTSRLAANAPYSATHITADVYQNKGGAGLGNVENKMLPSTDGRDLFKHSKYPRTASIIG
jgi:hypothetical protein